MNVFVLTDNRYLYENFKHLAARSPHRFDFYHSPASQALFRDLSGDAGICPIRLSEQPEAFFSQYDVFFSLHSKQIFPEKLVCTHRCINVHPGYNPYNRGWFPQVHSILNKLPAGVTIHEMDTELDHGPIIVQQPVEILESDTSYDVYAKIQQLELQLLERYLDALVTGNYQSTPMHTEGNIQYKADFDRLCALDLDRVGTFREFYDLLRATTFAGYDNAYFYDRNGDKVFVSLRIKRQP